MTTNVVNQVAFLRTTREYPEEMHQLTVEVNKSYVDIANAVNNRIIGIFPVNRPAITGENWFLRTNLRQQSLRQVYTFTTTADIPIGFKITRISEFTRCWGEFTDNATGNWYGLIFSSNVGLAGQITFFIAQTASPTSDVIRFIVDGAAPPLSKGKIVLEWLSDVINLAIN